MTKKVEKDISGDLWIDKELYIMIPVTAENISFLQSWVSKKKNYSTDPQTLVNDAVESKVRRIKAQTKIDS